MRPRGDLFQRFKTNWEKSYENVTRFRILQKDISLFLHIQFIKPQVIFPQFVLYNAHAQRADLEVGDDSVELRKAGKAEEDVHNVGCQLGASLPIFTKNSCQRTDCRLYRNRQDQRQCSNCDSVLAVAHVLPNVPVTTITWLDRDTSTFLLCMNYSTQYSWFYYRYWALSSRVT